ncbi:hypothetical protein GF369_04755 [Candidatus Peregrinibacteria bacterium]|nr:hypothetical protein [Candidatus Peregrinibacteria bacterium]
MNCLRVIIGMFSLLMRMGAMVPDCSDLALVYTMNVVHTQEENGVMTLLDRAGNGASVYEVCKTMHTVTYNDIVRKPYRERVLADGGILIERMQKTAIDPFDLFLYYEGEEKAVYAFLYIHKNTETHEAFQQKIMHIARKKAQGGCNETAWCNDWCIFNGVCFR